MTSFVDDSLPGAKAHPGAALGVIDDARRRRRRRHTRAAASVVLVVALIGGLAWALGGEGSRASRAAVSTPTLAAAQREARQAGFDVRLVPSLSVGYAGWCAIPVERGRTDGSACGPLSASAAPVLQAFGWGESGRSVAVAVTDPDVASIQLGGRRVPTVSLPGLPYGLRAARVLNGGRGGLLVAYDARGQRISEPLFAMPRKHAAVRTWRRPNQPPAAACRLGAPAGLRGVETLGGSVSLSVEPYAGAIPGHAFTTCAMAEYRLGGEPLKAFVLVDAAAPARFAALLPGFHAIRHGQRYYADGGLVARRYRSAWIVARQGKSVGERIALLDHLAATIPSS